MKVDELMKIVNETYEKNINMKYVFGETIEKDGVTIIPVAKVSAKVGEGNTFNFRIGLPSSHEKGLKEKKSDDPDLIEKNVNKPGYSIDAKLSPIGYIEIKDGRAQYSPILDITRMGLAGICFAGVSVFLITRMFTKFARIHAHTQQIIQSKRM